MRFLLLLVALALPLTGVPLVLQAQEGGACGDGDACCCIVPQPEQAGASCCSEKEVPKVFVAPSCGCGGDHGPGHLVLDGDGTKVPPPAEGEIRHADLALLPTPTARSVDGRGRSAPEPPIPRA